MVAVFGLIGAALAVQPAFADSVGQQEQEVKDVVAEINRQNEKIDQYNEQYLEALNEKAAVEADIAVSQQHIAEQQAALVVLQGQLANVAVEQFMGGGNALGPLFEDPAAIDDGLQREHLATVAVNAGAASTDDYETLLSDLDKAQRDLENKQQHAADLATKADASKAKAEQASADLQDRLVKERAKLGTLIEEEQAREDAAAEAAYQQQLAQAQAAAAARAAANAPTKSSSNGDSGNGNGGSNSGNGGSNSGNGGGNSGSGSDSSGSSGNSSGNGSSGSSNSGSGDGGSSGGGDSGASNPPPVSSRAGVAVSAAQSQLGVKYQFAQSSPGVAFDCSGLTAYAWGQAGVSIPHQSAAQYASTPHVPQDQAQPGDLVFYYSPISHVGLYVGGGSMIHAPQTGSVVSYSVVHWNKVVGVSRPG
jgi:peptidoglycan DL-endopeptidase CwlO